MKTARDLTDYLITFLVENPTGQALLQAKQAAEDALRELNNNTNWSYYYRSGRVATVAPYSTGTIAYTHTGGTYERQVALTGGTWPAWATYGVLYIANIAYEVEERKTATVLTLTSQSNLGGNVASGTSYNLYRDIYPLPNDFRAVAAVTVANNLASLTYVHPTRWHDLVRNFRSSGTPTTFTVFGDANYVGALSIGFFPYPDVARQIDFVYQRRPRTICVWDYHDGTISTTNGSATVTGSGTTFTSRMLGSSLRISPNTTDLPTGLDGGNPYSMERIILDVTNATTLRVDANADSTLTGVKYVLSDPIDVDEGVMLTVLLRCAEKHLAIKRRMRETPTLQAAYTEALLEARAADSRYLQRWGMDPDRYRVRWAHHPLGADVS